MSATGTGKPVRIPPGQNQPPNPLRAAISDRPSAGVDQLTWLLRRIRLARVIIHIGQTDRGLINPDRDWQQGAALGPVFEYDALVFPRGQERAGRPDGLSARDPCHGIDGGMTAGGGWDRVLGPDAGAVVIEVRAGVLVGHVQP